MLDKKDPRVLLILKEFHKKVKEKSRRFERGNDDIMRENMALQVLFRKDKLSPAACAEQLFESFGYGCTVEDMISVYRDYKINSWDRRREVFGRALELVGLLQQAMQGDKQALASYNDGFKAFLNNENVKRPQRYSRVVLAAAFHAIPELCYEDDQDVILNFGDTMSKYLLYDLENAIRATYNGDGRRRERQQSKPPVAYSEHEQVLQKLAQLESALEQSNMLLEDLQSEFDERLEAVKVQELSEFFGKLNSDRYGCILDELLTLRKGVELIRKSGYDLPLEINGLLIMVKKLVQFLRDNHIDPMLRPDSVRCVKAGDVEFWNYEGTPFSDAQEEKQVRVISPGWIYSEKQVQISRPKVKEVTDNDQY